MKVGTRLDRVDALRALALLPVLVVNLASFQVSDPQALLAPSPADSGLAWLLVWLVSALLLGKGVTLLNFLLGYSLTLGRDPERRARRLLFLGLLHGFLLFYGDILSSYALAGLMAWRLRRARLRGLIRRALGWTLLGSLLFLAMSLSFAGGSPGTTEPGYGNVAQAQGLFAWWLANAELYGLMLLALPVTLPLSYGLALLGLAAGRLRVFSHRRWRSVWRRLARAAVPLVGINLALALALMEGRGVLFMGLLPALALLTLPSWVAWLLSRAHLPRALVLAGRNTLSMYLGSSLLIVLLLSGAGLHAQPGTGAVLAIAVLAWAGLAAISASAAARGYRLPAEAWMARP